MKLIPQYHYTIVNDTLEHAAQQLEEIIAVEKKKQR